MGTEMTDEQLGALARRLADSGWKDPRVCNFDDIAREAARWAQERERERLEPLRVAVEAIGKIKTEFGNSPSKLSRLSNAERVLFTAARALLKEAK